MSFPVLLQRSTGVTAFHVRQVRALLSFREIFMPSYKRS